MRYSSAAFSVFVLFVTADSPLPAQYPPPGRYPPGTPPVGCAPGYPCDAGGISLPRREKKKKKKDAEQQDLQALNGMLRRLDDKFVIIETKDTRILNLKRQTTTRFFKNGDEIKPDALKPGDHLYVECHTDDQGFFYAVNVSLEKEGTAEERDKASEPVEVIDVQPANSDSDRPVLRRKDSPPAAEVESGPPQDKPTTQPAAQAGAQPAATQASKAPPAPAEPPPPAPPEAGLDLDHIPASTRLRNCLRRPLRRLSRRNHHRAGRPPLNLSPRPQPRRSRRWCI